MASEKKLTEQIVARALKLGADLAGIARVETLKSSPSHVIYGKLDHYRGIGSRQGDVASPGAIAWPTGFRSAVVIAVAHPENKPELDWWYREMPGGTRGNRKLIRISTELTDWLEARQGLTAKQLPYHIESGGIFLKDAAALAGLGCIGRNNMFVSEKYGPRVRMRSLLLEIELSSTGPTKFDPCAGCEKPCLTACPRGAFQHRIYHQEDYPISDLPGRNGFFSRDLCNDQMQADTFLSGGNQPSPERGDDTDNPVKYCRRCEFSCTAGKV